MSLMKEVLIDPLPPASERAAASGRRLPEGFEAWFARSVQRTPEDRFSDANEAWRALAPVLERASAGVAATMPMVDARADTELAPAEAIPERDATQSKKRNRSRPQTEPKATEPMPAAHTAQPLSRTVGDAPPRPWPMRRYALFAVVGAFALTAIIAIGFAQSGGVQTPRIPDIPRPDPPTVTTTVAVPTPAPSAAEKGDDMVRVCFKVQPAGVRIEIDGITIKDECTELSAGLGRQRSFPVRATRTPRSSSLLVATATGSRWS